MKWTRGRLKEKETVEYFMPKHEGILIKDSDWQTFFDLSERGIKTKEQSTLELKNGYDVILEGKRWRDIHMNMWEEVVLEGSIGYLTLLGMEDKKEIPPRSVVDFMKRDMFSGIDAGIIEDCYQFVLKNK